MIVGLISCQECVHLHGAAVPVPSSWHARHDIHGQQVDWKLALLPVALQQLVKGEGRPMTTNQTCSKLNTPTWTRSAKESLRTSSVRRPRRHVTEQLGAQLGAFTGFTSGHQGRFHPVPRLKLARQMCGSMFWVDVEKSNGACKNHRWFVSFVGVVASWIDWLVFRCFPNFTSHQRFPLRFANFCWCNP